MIDSVNIYSTKEVSICIYPSRIEEYYKGKIWLSNSEGDIIISKRITSDDYKSGGDNCQDDYSAFMAVFDSEYAKMRRLIKDIEKRIDFYKQEGFDNIKVE